MRFSHFDGKLVRRNSAWKCFSGTNRYFPSIIVNKFLIASSLMVSDFIYLQMPRFSVENATHGIIHVDRCKNAGTRFPDTLITPFIKVWTDFKTDDVNCFEVERARFMKYNFNWSYDKKAGKLIFVFLNEDKCFETNHTARPATLWKLGNGGERQ